MGAVVIVWLLSACGPSPDTAPAAIEPTSMVVPLDAPRLLRRASLDLRGVLPSTDELDTVEADPERVDEMMLAYLDDARLEDQLVSMFGERWLTLLDSFELQTSDYDLSPDQEYTFERSVGEEPLRLMARIAVDDLPWTDIVTTDMTVANLLLKDIWPLEFPEGATGWQESRYTDGRPAAGVLATNGLWWRYVTNDSNMNRSRAAAISRLLLCQDILSRPVSLTGAVDLASGGGTEEAIRTVPGCVACHSTVDPLAASLFGFYVTISYNTAELGYYHPEREQMGAEYLGVEPAYFGEPVSGLVDLGRYVANDRRFAWCAAETAAELMWRRQSEIEDFDQVDALRLELIDNEWRYRDLLAAVLETDAYRAGGYTDDATEADQREVTWRMMPPSQIAAAVQDITGFRWTWEGFDQLQNDDPGYRVLAGGVDGYAVTRPLQDPGITWSLVTQRNAQLAAAAVVRTELEQGEPRHLFTVVDLDDRPGDDAFHEELAQLHWRLYAVRPDEERIAAVEDFWSEVDALEGPEEAWRRVISAMLRDPEFVGH